MLGLPKELVDVFKVRVWVIVTIASSPFLSTSEPVKEVSLLVAQLLPSDVVQGSIVKQRPSLSQKLIKLCIIVFLQDLFEYLVVQIIFLISHLLLIFPNLVLVIKKGPGLSQEFVDVDVGL